MLMVEQRGPIVAAPAGVQDAEAKPGSFEVGRRTFGIGSGWRTNQVARLHAALKAIPPRLLPPAGTLFKREAVKVCTAQEIAADKCDPEWSGLHQYDVAAKRHTITLFDRAFAENA